MTERKHRIELSIFLLTLALAIVGSSCKDARTHIKSQTLENGESPNFIVILTDDQGFGDLGSFGGEHVHTPNLDRMAKEGARLINFYTAASICTPSRAALLTGCYPKRNGMASRVLLAGDSLGLHPDEITIAEVLKSKGYATGIVGKWHLGDQPQFLPTRQGFDYFFGLPYSHDIHPWHPNNIKFNFPNLPLLEGEKVIEVNPGMNTLSQRLTQKAVTFIEQNKDNSFFLYFPHPLPHRPLYASRKQMITASDSLKKVLLKEDGSINYKLRDQIYPQAISTIDDNVGQLIRALVENGLDKKTFVFFTSDNGPARGGLGSTGEFRGRKGETLEGGMRMPTLAWMPGQIPSGSVIEEVTSTLDLLPTIAHLAGVEIPKDRKIDGSDIWTRLISSDFDAESKKPFFFFNKNKLEAVRIGDWKLYQTKEEATLYNLSKDKGEQINLLNDNPEVVKEINVYFKQMQLELGEGNKSSEVCRPAGIVRNPKILEMLR